MKTRIEDFLKYFLILNLVAFYYGFILFVQTELIVNVYRIQRLIPWVNQNVLLAIITVIFLISTITFYLINTKCFKGKKLRYLLTVLWIPYFIVLVRLFVRYFPINDPGEVPLGGIGIVLLLLYILYPFYIALLNIDFSHFKQTISGEHK